MSVVRERVRKLADLAAAESKLRAALQHGDASPFLGQHELDRRAANLIQGNCLGVDPVGILVTLFEEYPAATVAFLAGIARSETGRSGNGEFYPHLEEELGEPLSPHDRQRLFAAFRGACVRLGLPIMGEHEIRAAGTWARVAQYFQQAGPADLALPTLAAACLGVERDLGTPDPVDPDGLSLWHAHLLDGLAGTGLGRILEADRNAWHAACFARLRTGAGPSTPFERKFLDAILCAPPLKSGGRAGPALSLLYEDGEILLAAPPQATGWTWTVTGGWEGSVLVRPGEAIPVSTEEALEVVAERLGGDDGAQPSRRLSLWDGAKVLAFEGRAGRRVGSVVPAGPVHLTARTPFSVDGKAAQLQPSGLQVATLVLTDGQAAFVRFEDGATSQFLGRAEPVLEWGSGVVTFLGAAPVLSGADLTLEVLLPRQTAQAWGDDLQVVFRTRERELARADLRLDADGAGTVSLDPHPGERFQRVTAGVVRRGEDRALVQARSAWLWPGLTSADDGFFTGPVPRNFDPVASIGVSAAPTGIGVEVDAGATPVLAFSRAEGGLHRLILKRPGIHLELENASGRRDLPLGATVIDDGSPRFLRITSDDPDATLLFGAGEIARAFATSPTRRVQLHSITGETGEGRVSLHLRGDPGRELPLATVTRAYAPRDPACPRLGGRTWLEFGAEDDTQSFRLVGTDLFSGEQLELARHAGLVIDCSAARVRLAADPRCLPDGLWVLEARCVLPDRAEPRPLRAPRGDAFALLAPVAERQFTSPADRIAHPPSGFNLISAFLRVHRTLCACWAEACWRGGLDALDRVWFELGGTLATAAARGDVEASDALIRAAGLAPPPESNPTWSPLRHPLELWRDLFSTPSSRLAALLADAEDEGLRAFSALLSTPADTEEERSDRHADACRRFAQRVSAAVRNGGNIERMSDVARLCRAAERAEVRRGSRSYPRPSEEDLLATPLLADAPAFFHGLAFASQFGATAGYLESLAEEAQPGRPPARQAGFLCRLGPELLAWHMDFVHRSIS